MREDDQIRTDTTAGARRFLHVANGTCTTDTLAAAGLPGRRSVWADPLYEGPVPGGLTDDELLEVRLRFHNGSATGPRDALPDDHPSRDPANDMRQWRATIADHTSYDELILWFEHDLFDQLNLIQLLAWIGDHPLPASTRLSLICIGSFPGRPAFSGLGELAPRELLALLDTRQPVRAAELDLSHRAWRAFREPSPASLDALRRTDTSALPFLAPAILRFLQEFPWTHDGLSRSERRLMQLASGNGVPLQQAFTAMHADEQVYYITDRSLAALADGLCRTSPALLTHITSPGAKTRILRGTVALTEAGRSVLAGQMDRVALCGIDRWLGGVHLRNQVPIWRWHDREACVALV